MPGLAPGIFASGGRSCRASAWKPRIICRSTGTALEADTLEQACRLAVEDDDWSDEKRDYESAGETFVSSVWPGLDAAYRGVPVPIPSHFRETNERKAAHFETLLGILKILARARESQTPDFPFWLARAGAAIAKAEAILAGAPDPG